MKTRKLKEWVIPTIYLSAVLLFVGCIYTLVIGVQNFFSEKRDFDYSINAIDNPVPVIYSESSSKPVAQVSSIVKPYKGENITIGRSYYDINSDIESQEKSIIFYENTYIQNTGVDYISDNSFEVVSISF